MRLHVTDLGWVEYVTLRCVVSACTGGLTCEIFAKIIFADSLQWPVCNKKDSSHCNYNNLKLSPWIRVRVRVRVKWRWWCLEDSCPVGITVWRGKRLFAIPTRTQYLSTFFTFICSAVSTMYDAVGQISSSSVLQSCIQQWAWAPYCRSVMALLIILAMWPRVQSSFKRLWRRRSANRWG